MTGRKDAVSPTTGQSEYRMGPPLRESPDHHMASWEQGGNDSQSREHGNVIQIGKAGLPPSVRERCDPVLDETHSLRKQNLAVWKELCKEALNRQNPRDSSITGGGSHV